MSPSRTTACSTSAAAFSGPTPPLKTAVAGRAAAIAARTSSGSSASRPENDPAWTKSAPPIRATPAKTAGATPTGRSRIHRAAPTRCANRGTPSSAWRSIRNASSPCAKTLSISAVAPSCTARSARSSSESTGPVMFGAYSVRSGSTAATARTRFSKGHQSGFASSSSSFTSAAPPRANTAAVSATCSGDSPSDGLRVQPAPDGPTAYLCVGSLIERKNVLRLADAFARLGEGTLTFVGDGPLRPALEERPGITVTGRVGHDEIPARLAASQVLCQPSLIEPFGLALLEGMAAGRSVVATRVGGPPEFVPVEAGALVDPTDVDDIVRGLRAAAALPCPNEAARRAAEAHDVRRQADRIQAILERAARGRRGEARRAA